MSSAFANKKNGDGSSIMPTNNNRAKTSQGGGSQANQRQEVLSTLKSYEQNMFKNNESRLSSIGNGPQSKSTSMNPFKLTSTIIETIGG